MSKAIITQYYTRVDKIIQFGGSRKETSVRNEFYNLLNHYAEKRNLVLVPELPIRGTKGKDVTPDGTLKNVLRLEYGYWESKDESLDLHEEIDKKIKKGYPLNNILFEDSKNAVLFQGGEEVMGVDMRKGLTCDPMKGLVQIPCIERNAQAASRALDAAIYARMTDGHHFVPFDKVIRVMKETGHDLPSIYKETAEGGLAKD